MGRAGVTPESLPFQIATWLIPLVFAIVLHEISHARLAAPPAELVIGVLARIAGID